MVDLLVFRTDLVGSRCFYNIGIAKKPGIPLTDDERNRIRKCLRQLSLCAKNVAAVVFLWDPDHNVCDPDHNVWFGNLSKIPLNASYEIIEKASS